MKYNFEKKSYYQLFRIRDLSDELLNQGYGDPLLFAEVSTEIVRRGEE